MGKGDYFTKAGYIDENVGVNYLKADRWELNPSMKGPPPQGSNFAQFAMGYQRPVTNYDMGYY